MGVQLAATACIIVIAVLCGGANLFSDQRGANIREALEGTWNSGTATPVERPAALDGKAVFTPEEAAAWERQVSDRNEEPASDAPRTGTGTYNTFYREWGTRVVKTRRTSIVVDPPDGRIPPLTPAAAEFRQKRLEAMRRAENPEDLGLQDQCLSFSTAGPPMLPYSYNSNYQIVVTKNVVLIHAEMIHDARIVHMDGRPHPPKHVAFPLGHSTGRWEGNTLVATTTNMKASYIRKNGPPMSDHATVTTRYFRHGDLLAVDIDGDEVGFGRCDHFRNSD